MDNIFFLSCFLPLTLAVYWLVPGIKGKNAVLLVFSLLFYSFGSLSSLGLLLGVALARGLGYDAYALAGTCTKTEQPHGWVQIEFDGEDYFFDPEWHYDYIHDKREVKDMFKISLEDADWWYYKWIPVKKDV